MAKREYGTGCTVQRKHVHIPRRSNTQGEKQGRLGLGQNLETGRQPAQVGQSCRLEGGSGPNASEGEGKGY